MQPLYCSEIQIYLLQNPRWISKAETSNLTIRRTQEGKCFVLQWLLEEKPWFPVSRILNIKGSSSWSAWPPPPWIDHILTCFWWCLLLLRTMMPTGNWMRNWPPGLAAASHLHLILETHRRKEERPGKGPKQVQLLRGLFVLFPLRIPLLLTIVPPTGWHLPSVFTYSCACPRIPGKGKQAYYSPPWIEPWEGWVISHGHKAN